MTEEELKKLKFRECSHITYDDEYHTLYECVSEPLIGRLKLNAIVKRSKVTGEPTGKARVHYSLDGKLYKTKEKVLEAIKDEK